jgi:thiol peroxidase
MATITLKGNPFQTSGQLPAKGTAAPDFTLLGLDLAPLRLADLKGVKVLNVFPSGSAAPRGSSGR